MTDIAPSCQIDCEVLEIEPAVVDTATGNVVKPPVLQPPTITMVELDDDQRAARLIAQAEAASASAALAHAAETLAQQTALHERNRWLGESDAYMLPAASLPSDMPDDVKQAIASWRSELRDWPATVTDWRAPPPLPAPPLIPLSSGKPLIVVT